MNRYMIEQRRGQLSFVVTRRTPPEYRTELVERFKTYEEADQFVRVRCGPPDNHYEPRDEFSEGVWYIAYLEDTQ